MDEYKMLLLRRLPLTLHAFLLQEQAKIQLAEGKKISIERVIYRIIREKTEKKSNEKLRETSSH
jgi:hypothetical protein